MDDEKVICYKCVGEEYVKKEIQKIGSGKIRCSYCQGKRKSTPLYNVAEMMNFAFEHHYDSAMVNDIYGGFSGDPALSIIGEQLDVEEDIAEDIYSLLCELNNSLEIEQYSDDYEYRRRKYSSGDLDYSWQEVKDSLKKEARFFNQTVKDFLDSLFSDIENFQTENQQSPIKIFDTDTLLFRARTFESYDEVENALKHPEKNFGPPPSEQARAGRMNASGIPVFYGATSKHISIAEVRPPVGSYVVVAPFSILRPLRIFDINALDSLSISRGSIFDPETHKAQERNSFLKTFSRKLTLPVFGKNQDNEYLTTQAIAEYLGISEQYNLDGISFKSTQIEEGKKASNDECNIVLFSKSSKVNHANNLSRAYRVELFENVEEDQYMFSPCISLVDDALKKSFQPYPNFTTKNTATLELNSDEMTFHKVKGVKFQTDETDIIRKN